MCKFFKSLSLCMSRVPRPATCLCTVVNNTLFHFLFRFLPCLCQFSPILVTLKRNIYVLSIIFEQPSYVNLCTKSRMTFITSYTVHSIYLHSVPTTNIDYSPGRDLGVEWHNCDLWTLLPPKVLFVALSSLTMLPVPVLFHPLQYPLERE